MTKQSEGLRFKTPQAKSADRGTDGVALQSMAHPVGEPCVPVDGPDPTLDYREFEGTVSVELDLPDEWFGRSKPPGWDDD